MPTDNAQNCLPGVVSEVVDGADKKPRAGDPWCAIVIHHTGLPKQAPASESAWRQYHKNIVGWLAKRDDAYLSAHFQIGRMGEVTQLVNPDHFIAYHAGTSAWWHPLRRAWVEGWNAHAIGIELLGDGNVLPYSDAQYTALATLIRALRAKYPTINANMLIGHEQIAPGRKSDPGKLFDWNRVYSSALA